MTQFPTGPLFDLPPGGGYPVPGAGGLYPDVGTGVLVPQGTAVAGRGRRVGAYFLAFPLAVVTLGIGYAIWGLVVWGRGTTPALQVLGMRCWVPEQNRVAGFWRMALREIIGRFVEGILSVITLLISLGLFLGTGKRQSLHDLIGGTVVLHDPNKVLA